MSDPAAVPAVLLATRTAHPPRHPRFLEPASLLLITPLCVMGAIIGMQLLVTLGITPNTSLIGALAAMLLSRIPLALFARYRSIHVQNMAQSAISAATFGAGNSLLLPIGVPFVLGTARPGRADARGRLPGHAARRLHAFTRLFDSEVFPATGAWPPGIAAAEAIRAGDQGGRQLVILGAGLGVGVLGALLAVPMSRLRRGVIGNIWALSVFGIGLLIRGYSTSLFGAPVHLPYPGRRHRPGLYPAWLHGRRGASLR